MSLTHRAGTLAGSIASRPLVHVFFVQESLQFDSHQAVGFDESQTADSFYY
jgi:hypothetical protein